MDQVDLVLTDRPLKAERMTTTEAVVVVVVVVVVDTETTVIAETESSG